MNSLETLKNELLLQKTAIESRGGTVAISGTNPSPTEITNGIKTIETPDLSLANATVDDVLYGKTFYAQNGELKTGALPPDGTPYEILFLYNDAKSTTSARVYYTIPDGIKRYRNSLFRSNKNPITLTLNNDVEIMSPYCFAEATQLIFTNFNDLTNLTEIRDYAFYFCPCEGIDFSALPSSILRLEQRAFQNAISAGMSLKIPDGIQHIGSYCFGNSNSRVQLKNLTFKSYPAQLPDYCFFNIAFENDFVTPSNSTSINNYFAYKSNFNSVTITPNITKVGTYSFGAYTTDPVSLYTCKSFTFESETPPTFGSYPLGVHHFTNGCKMYVPDNSVEAYKAISALKDVVNYIYPMSQKE